MPENKNDAPAFNLEQFTEEELTEYIKASIENIGFDSEGVFHFIDPVLSTQVRPRQLPEPPKREKHLDEGSNAFYYVLGTMLTTLGTAIAAVAVNPILIAPGGLTLASILSAPIIVDKINSRKDTLKQIEATREVPEETFDLHAHVMQVLQPKLTHWLKESYNIEVSEDTATHLATQVIQNCNMSFTTLKGREYYLIKDGNKCRVKKWEGRVNGNSVFTDLATVGTMSTLPSTAFQPDLKTLQKHEPETETETVFAQKIKLLERHKLSTEAGYRLTAVKNEAAKIVAATTVLIDLGETSYHDKSDTAFALLNDELDAIISEKVEQEYFNLAVSEQFVSERYRKPLQLEKNKTEQISR